MQAFEGLLLTLLRRYAKVEGYRNESVSSKERPRHSFETFEDLALQGTTFEPRDPPQPWPLRAAPLVRAEKRPAALECKKITKRPLLSHVLLYASSHPASSSNDVCR